MGPKNACSYADLAMGEINHKAKFCGPIKPAQYGGGTVMIGSFETLFCSFVL